MKFQRWSRRQKYTIVDTVDTGEQIGFKGDFITV